MDTDIRNRSLRYGLREAYFSGTLTHLIGGIFLTGYAITLGANNFTLGVIAALPAAISVVHIYGSYIISKNRVRKDACIRNALISRIAIAGIICIPLLPLAGINGLQIPFLLFFLGIYYTFAALSLMNWLSWMYDLVPHNRRGRYFSRRNLIVTAIGLLVGIAGGKLVDLLTPLDDHIHGAGFSILFFFAFIAGAVSILMLRKMDEPVFEPGENPLPFRAIVKLPVRDGNFRKLIFFRIGWDFSVWMTAPFFIAYMIVELSLNYTFIAILAALTGTMNILTVRLWGSISDKRGNKFVLTICALAKALFPFPWLFVSPETGILLILIHCYAGAFDSGLNLTSTNISFKLSPQEYHYIYLAVYTVVVGIMSGIGPVTGGLLIDLIGTAILTVGSFELNSFHVVFVISGVLRLLSILLLNQVKEEEPVIA